MAALGEVLVVGFAGVVVLGGFGKMVYQLKRLSNQPPRRRQPWEHGGPT
jgi:hypothetical protein